MPALGSVCCCCRGVYLGGREGRRPASPAFLQPMGTGRLRGGGLQSPSLLFSFSVPGLELRSLSGCSFLAFPPLPLHTLELFPEVTAAGLSCMLSLQSKGCWPIWERMLCDHSASKSRTEQWLGCQVTIELNGYSV